MKKMGCLWLLIAALLLALLFEANAHHVNITLPLPSLNLKQAESLTASFSPVKLVQTRATQADAAGAYVVTGKPTITADFINEVLAAYHSPAAGLGQVLYDDGVNYGIDPAFALAFFMHESTFGKAGMARVTHSLGNMRCLPNYPCIQGYAGFQSWEQGFATWYYLIRDLYVGQWHLTTIEQILPRYAPRSDHNNVAAYITAVEHAVNQWRKGQVQV